MGVTKARFTVSVVLVRLKDILCCGIYVTPRQDTVATFGRRTNSLHARKRRPFWGVKHSKQ